MFQAPGLNLLIYDLARASQAIKGDVEDAVRQAAQNVESTARGFVPVRTGELRDSISSEVRNDGGFVVGEVGPTARHGRFVEWGTYKDAPQAFMGPALDRHSHELDERLGAAGENAI